MTEEELWEDLKKQLDGWMIGGWIPNSGPRRFATGYGGPYLTNVVVAKKVFTGALEKLRSYKKANDSLAYYSVNGPPSLSVTDGYDFIVSNGNDTKIFVYHVIVNG